MGCPYPEYIQGYDERPHPPVWRAGSSAPGDNVLAEFASVVDAVQCAVEIQLVLRAKNAVLPENRRMDFRIGINLGDVVEEREHIYGDGVNIAARLEVMATIVGLMP